VDGLYGDLPNHGVGELFLFGAGGCSVIQQAIDQSAQEIFIFQSGIAASSTAGGADYPSPVNDHNLRNVQNFASATTEIIVHVVLGRIAQRIGELQIIHHGRQKLCARAFGVWRIKNDADGLEAARAQFIVELVQRCGHAHAMLRFDEKKFHDHHFALETGKLRDPEEPAMVNSGDLRSTVTVGRPNTDVTRAITRNVDVILFLLMCASQYSQRLAG
jgi:hypothetical protein